MISSLFGARGKLLEKKFNKFYRLKPFALLAFDKLQPALPSNPQALAGTGFRLRKAP